MNLVELLLMFLFVGLGAGLGAAGGGRVGAWCGGIVGLGLLWMIGTRNARQLRRGFASEDTQWEPGSSYKAYRFNSGWEGDGEIRDGEDKPLWRCQSVGGNPFRSSAYGLFRLAPFVVQDWEGHELVAFRRIRRFPHSVFEIRAGSQVVGALHKQSCILPARYLLELESGMRCTFYLPYFTVWFHGTAETGGRIRIRLWGHRVWLVQLDSKLDTFHVVATIAFLHRERLRHG